MRKKYIYFYLLPLFFSALFLFNNAYAQQIPETPAAEAELFHLGAEINTPYSEYMPVITIDEDYIYFQSDRPGGMGQTGDFDIWRSLNKTLGSRRPVFNSPENIGFPINSEGFEGLPSVRKAEDGEWEMYFTSVSSMGRSGPDETNIYYSRTIHGKWTNPEPVTGINTHFNDRMPSISLDGKLLYFSSDRPGGFGKDDLWVSEYDNKTKRWKNPVNLGLKINGPASEISPTIHTDGITLYYSSNKKGGVGGFDIYVTQNLERKDLTSWSDIKNLGIPYNSVSDDEHPSVNLGGRYMYFCSNRDGGYGNFDIYRAKIPKFAKPIVVVKMQGRVHEADTMKGIEANIRIEGRQDSRNITTDLPNGSYWANFINNRIYKILISAPGYEPEEFTLDLREIHEPDLINKNFLLKRRTGIPSEFTFNISFSNKLGQKLKPSVYTKLLPTQKKEREITPVEDKAQKKYIYRFNLHIPAEIEGAAEVQRFINNLSVETSATLPGYDVFLESFFPKNYIDITQKDIGRQFDIDYTMLKLGSEFPMTLPEDLKNMRRIYTIYFQTNIYSEYKEEDRKNLMKIISAWKSAPEMFIEIHGHTDAEGGKPHNIWLSKRRAENVKKFLTENGISENKIIIKWFADSRPVAENKTEQGKSKNRRTEIFAYSKEDTNAKNK
ncbi:MAG: OmpA family protein [Spirochaetia bacterium]|nr:OmpA family protein [Spirochaetia bacterium]